MSKFVLNRNYQLQLPNSFVDVEREEMEYVDGGMYVSERWWGIAINLSVAECTQMAIELRASVSTKTLVGKLMMTTSLSVIAAAAFNCQWIVAAGGAIRTGYIS